MRRGIWKLLLVFAALVAIWFVLNNHPGWIPIQPAGTPETTSTASQMIFSPEDGMVAAIQIESKDGKITVIKRGEDGLWVVEKPVSSPANQAFAEAAASQVSAILISKTLEENPADSATGLDKPSYSLTVTFANGKVSHLAVGNQTPIATGYYARGDNGKVVIISNSGIEALLTLLYLPPVATPDAP
jgi:hypothetical protein